MPRPDPLWARRCLSALCARSRHRDRVGLGDDQLHGDQRSEQAGPQWHRHRSHQLHQLLDDRSVRPDLRADAGRRQRRQRASTGALSGHLPTAALRCRARDPAHLPAAGDGLEGARLGQSANRTTCNQLGSNGRTRMSTTVLEPKAKAKAKSRPDFERGLWMKEINVRHFIQQNYTPYHGDESFLAGPTKRTTALWKKLTDLFVEERKKGVLDISQIPSTITAHDAGYIDKGNEVIVGLQTEAPLKRAIMPNGGLRMVLNSLETYGYKPDPVMVDTFTKYRKTHNDGVFDAYTSDVRKCRS